MVKVLWSRLVDEENMGVSAITIALNAMCVGQRILSRLGPEHQTKLQQQLGFLTCFNMLDPEGDHVLDFGVRDQRIIATCLLRLGTKEKGNNITNESFNGNPGGSSSRWITQPPASGIWKVTYSCEPENVNVALRKQLAERYLGWHFEEEKAKNKIRGVANLRRGVLNLSNK